MNNNCWGSEKAYQRHFYGGALRRLRPRQSRASTGTRELFGAAGYYVERPEADRRRDPGGARRRSSRRSSRFPSTPTSFPCRRRRRGAATGSPVPRPVVVFLDAHDPEVRAVIAAECPARLDLRMATSDAVGDRLGLVTDAAFFVGGISAIPASLMDAAPGLRLIQKWGIGVDKIDLAAARARGIPVAITAGANAVPVAEFTLLLMLAVLRRLPAREAEFRGGEWHRPRRDTRLQARQLRGKRVALVGLGAIGRQVAKRLQAFDVDVRYFDIRRPTLAEEQTLGVRFQELDALLAEADIVSLHVPTRRPRGGCCRGSGSRGSGRERS